MLFALPVLSFLCVGLLSVFLPVPRINSSFVNISLVLWLITGNIIHGINAIVWSGNTDFHIPVWCDIVTKALLGANVALPGACVCIAIHLEYLSSKRPILNNRYIKKSRLLFQVILCFFFPILYMSLHFIAQDHRFNILEDFGPFASIHPSTPALIIIWIPPLIVCSISFLFSGFAISHSFSYSAYNFRDHLASRCEMTSSFFFRRVVAVVTLTSVLTVVNLFALFSPPNLVPWVSWDSVHQHSGQIKIITQGDDVANAKLMWWGIPVTSLVYIFLSFVIGEEARDAGRWIARNYTSFKEQSWKTNLKPLMIRPSNLLPIHENDTEMTLRSPSRLSHSHLTLVLKSGWDDMLHDKSPPKRSRSTNTQTTRSSSSSPSSPTPPSPSTISEDKVFVESTLDYLYSPVARSLGLQSPLLSAPSPVYATCIPNKVFIEKASPIEVSLPRQPIPEDASSIISSFMDVPWPLPPSSAPPSSLRSDDSITYSNPRPATPPPFQSSLAMLGPGEKPNAKSHAKWPSVSSLRRNWSVKSVPGEVVYMTVVQETV